MIDLDPYHYSHHYINPASAKAVVSKTYFKDEKDAYISRGIRRDKEARRYFEGTIAPYAVEKSYETDYMANYALELLKIARERNFVSKINADGKTSFEFEEKRQGFRKTTVIRMFENGALKRKFEVTPKKSAKMYEYQEDLNHYNYYEIDFSKKKKIYKEGIEEEINGHSLKLNIDKIFTYQGDILQKYEEGFKQETEGGYPKRTILKRFVPDYYGNIINYSENIVKESPFKKESVEYSTTSGFKRYYEV